MANEDNQDHKRCANVPPGTIRSNKLIDILSKTTTDTKMVSWNGIHIRVRTILSAEEYMKLIHKILDDCIVDDSTVAIELLDFSMRINILASYANIELPEEFEAMYALAYKGSLYETIFRAVNQEQVRSIEKSLQYYVNMLRR